MTDDRSIIINFGMFSFTHMKFKFEKLLIWQEAMKFGEEINTLADSFPPKELYNLSSQIRRAADSIALNISEGSIGQSNPEQHKFIEILNNKQTPSPTSVSGHRSSVKKKHSINTKILQHETKNFP